MQIRVGLPTVSLENFLGLLEQVFFHTLYALHADNQLTVTKHWRLYPSTCTNNVIVTDSTHLQLIQSHQSGHLVITITYTHLQLIQSHQSGHLAITVTYTHLQLIQSHQSGHLAITVIYQSINQSVY